MRIQRLKVTNFRCFSNEVEFEIDDNNIILFIGRNNAGKSSLLNAYEYFIQSGKKSMLDDFYQKNPEQYPIEIEAWIQTESDEERTKQAIRKWTDSEGIVKIKKIWSQAGGSGAKQSWDPNEQSWIDGGAGGFDSMLQNALPTPHWLSGLSSPTQVLDWIQKLLNIVVIKKAEQLEEYEKAAKAFESLAEAIIEQEYTQELQQRLNNSMANVFPHIKVKLGSNADANFEKAVEKGTTISLAEHQGPNVDVTYHGHGVQRQLVLSALHALREQISTLSIGGRNSKSPDALSFSEDTTTNTRDAVLLIEEPELFLHPQAMRVVQKLLYDLGENSPFQILAATHSPVMIDLTRPHVTLVRVERDDSHTKIHQIKSQLFNEDEKKSLRMMLDFDPYVCEAFFAEHVLLVEGDTEVAAYRRLVQRMIDANIITLDNAPHIINCGSKNNIPTFAKVLTHFNISHFIIHDLDTPLTSSGSANSAWKLNENIWAQIIDARKRDCVSNRYIMNQNFEEAHGYKYVKSKPYSAYSHADTWDINDDTIPAIASLRLALRLTVFTEEHDQEWVEKHASHPETQT